MIIFKLIYSLKTGIYQKINILYILCYCINPCVYPSAGHIPLEDYGKIADFGYHAKVRFNQGS